jgi:hypothetical protein
MWKIYTKLKNIINEQKWIRDLLHILQFTNATNEQEKRLIEIYKNGYWFWIKEHNIKMEIWDLEFDEQKYIDEINLI